MSFLNLFFSPFSPVWLFLFSFSVHLKEVIYRADFPCTNKETKVLRMAYSKIVTGQLLLSIISRNSRLIYLSQLKYILTSKWVLQTTYSGPTFFLHIFKYFPSFLSHFERENYVKKEEKQKILLISKCWSTAKCWSSNIESSGC